MRKSRFTDEQVIGFIKQADAGMSVVDLCRREGFSSATFYKWRAKFGGMRSRPLTWLAYVVVGLAVMTAGCRPAEPPPRECPQPPVVDGHVRVQLEETGTRVRIPVPVGPVDFTADCSRSRGFELAFYWYQGRLFHEATYRFKFPEDQVTRVRLYVRPLLPNRKNPLPTIEAWRFEPALPHERYPLDLYPRFHWSAPDQSPAREPPDTTWGVRGSRDALDGLPITAYCDILKADPGVPLSRVRGEFSTHGDSKCRSRFPVIKAGHQLSVLIDVPADGASQIDRIHKAVAEELFNDIEE